MPPVRPFLAVLFLVLSSVAAAESPLVIDGAWVRALPPTQPNTAAYLNIQNRGPGDVEQGNHHGRTSVGRAARARAADVSWRIP